MPDPRTACVPPERLRDFVEERLDARAEAAVAQHIEDCAPCQARIESLTAGAAEWASVQRQLDDPMVVDGSAFGEAAQGDIRDGDRDLQQLQSYFGPTDDPTKLGRLGRYEVVGFVGKGSTGVVLKAFEPQLGRYVAIKVLSPSFASNGPARARFQREARAIAAVSHEHVVPVFAVDEYAGLPFIVMQYASGGSLQQRIERSGPLGGCEAMRIGIQIARGLSEAHGQGIVHRDVKPANVMLEGEVDRAMVTDFGLARVADEAAMTRSGVVAGTPQYMSPEQARGEPVDARSDLFSLGAVLYTACTGRSPFRAGSVFGVIKRVCEDQPRSIREIAPTTEPWLEAFIEKLLAKPAEDRFASAREVAELLSQELAHAQSPTVLPTPERAWWRREPSSSTPSRWRSALPIGVGALALSALVFGFLFGRGDADTNAGEGRGNGDGSMARSAMWSPGGLSLFASDDETDEPTPEAGGTPLLEHHSERTVDLAPGGTCRVSSDFEAIRVHHAEDGQARARVVRLVYAHDVDEVERVVAQHSVKIVEDDTEQLVLACEFEPDTALENGLSLRMVTLDVWLPEECDIELRSSSGSIEVGNLVGSVLAHSATGAIQTGRVSGNVEARSTTGSIAAQLASGDYSATTTTGAITVEVVSPAFDSCRLSSATGAVALGVREGEGVSIDARTLGGRVAHPGGITSQGGQWRHDLAGGGSPITLRSDGGPIEVNYSHPPEPQATNETGGCDESDDCDEGEDCDEECDSDDASEVALAPTPGRVSIGRGTFPGEVIDGYALYLPLSHGETETRYPLIVSLAGGCYVGGPVENLLCNGLMESIGDRLEDGPDLSEEYDRLLLDSFIVVAPHMRAGPFEERQFFDQEAAIGQILDDIVAAHHGDPSRVYVTGAGRGGHGAWGLAARMPERFAAAVPIRGQNIGITDYSALAGVPIWAGHLACDREVDIAHTREAIQRIEDQGGEPFLILDSENPNGDEYLAHDRLFTTYSGGGWPNLFGSAALFRWLLRHERVAQGPATSAIVMDGEERFR